MRGTNEVAKIRPPGSTFRVHSMFYTIQGEGPWAGWPAIFVRLAGCNLRCSFCDTEFEHGAHEIPGAALVHLMGEMADKHKCTRFVITGGEPMLQPLTEIFRRCREEIYGCSFQIETAGTVWPVGLEDLMPFRVSSIYGEGPFVTIVCSPKTPAIHRKVVDYCVHWKYIVQAGRLVDGLWPRAAIGEGPAFRPAQCTTDTIYMQPCDEGDPSLNAQNMKDAVQLCLDHGYRLSVQVHKIAGVE